MLARRGGAYSVRVATADEFTRRVVENRRLRHVDGDPHAAARIGRASTHWLRHTFGTQAIETGVPIDIVRENPGHASPATTSIYVTAELDRRIRALESMERSPTVGKFHLEHPLIFRRITVPRRCTWIIETAPRESLLSRHRERVLLNRRQLPHRLSLFSSPDSTDV
ncbi:MAG: tyrosine-type recombinase/integrase [Janthinobacterium lividum]